MNIDKFYFEYAKTKFGFTENEAIEHRKLIESTFGYNAAFIGYNLNLAANEFLKEIKKIRIKLN